MTDQPARAHDHSDEGGLAGDGLADDLLRSQNPADAETEVSKPGPAGSRWSDLADDEDYLAPAAGRGKLTTGLLVALIFLIGILVGAVLTKTLSPAPAPQIVYVLNDSSPSTAPTTPATPR